MSPEAQKAMEMTRMITREPKKPSIFLSPGFGVFMFILLVIAVAWITYTVAKSIKEKQEGRIKNKLNYEIGDKLRNILPIDAIVYTADTHAMTYQEENGNFKIISYSSLGMDRLPDNYEYVVCQWIRDNIVYDSANYHLESMTYERDHYEESDTVTIKREYRGKYIATRNPGRYVTTQTTIGHALVHNGYDFEGHRVNTKPLKKW